jgi:hypothetical protein
MSSVTYAIYDQTGRIDAVVSGPSAEAYSSVENAILYDLEEDLDPELFYVADQEFVAIPESPSPRHEFDYDSKQWVIVLDNLKAAIWDEIKQSRDAEEFGVFSWGEYVFDCDEVSQRRLQGAVQLAALDPALVMEWTLADDTAKDFTSEEYGYIGLSLAAHVNAAHIKARQLREQINSAQTPEELDVIAW